MQSQKAFNSALVPEKSAGSADSLEALNCVLDQLDISLISLIESYPSAQLFQSIETCFQDCLRASSIDVVWTAFNKMKFICEKYSLLALHARMARDEFPLVNAISIKLTSHLGQILIRGALGMLNQWVVDERFLGESEFEKSLYTQFLFYRQQILRTIINQGTLLVKSRFVWAYHLITTHAPSVANHDTSQSLQQDETIEELLLSQQELESFIDMLQNTHASIEASYELNKTIASGFYLQARFAEQQGKLPQAAAYKKKYQAFLSAYDEHIKQDDLMSVTFGFAEISVLCEQLAAKPPESNAKKKKNKKKQPKTIAATATDIAVLLPPAGTTLWERKWLVIVDDSIQKKQETSLAQTEIESHIANAAKQVISLFCQHEYAAALELYQQNIKHAGIVLNHLRTTQQGDVNSNLFKLYEILISIGIECIWGICQKIDEASLLTQTPLRRLETYFCQSPIISTQAPLSLKAYAQIHTSFLSKVLDSIDTQASMHLLTAECQLDCSTFSPANAQQVASIENHLARALQFHEHIYPVIVYQHQAEKEEEDDYLLAKISYLHACLTSRLRRAQQQNSAADLLDQTSNEFKQKYAQRIETDPFFCKENLSEATNIVPIDLPAPLGTLLLPVMVQKLSETEGALRLSLQAVQQSFREQLPNHYNSSNFQKWFNTHKSTLESALVDCFRLDHLKFSETQFDHMNFYIRQFSLFSLNTLCQDKSREIITEQNIAVVCGLMETLLNAGYIFIARIEAQQQISLFSGMTFGKNHNANCGYKQLFLQKMVHCVLHLARTHVLLSQALISTAVQSHHAFVAPKAKKHLEKSTEIQEKFFNVVNKKSVLIRAFGYQFILLKEMDLAIRAKIERGLGHLREAIALEIEKERLGIVRQKDYPVHSKNDQNLTPSYGYEELNTFLHWLDKQHTRADHTLSGEAVEHIATQNTNHNTPKKTRRKKKKSKDQACSPVREIALRADSPLVAEEAFAQEDIDLQTTPLALKDESISTTAAAVIIVEDGHPDDVPRVAKCLLATNRLPLFSTKNPVLNDLFNEMHHIINPSSCAGFVYMYGSAIFKTNPDDFDLCVLGIKSPQDMLRVNELIATFIKLGARIKPINSECNEYGYRDKGRHTIPMIWAGIKIDITTSEKTDFIDFSNNLDYSACALCYDFQIKDVYSIDALAGWKDIDERELNTIDDPMTVFTADPSRVLRGIRLIALEGFNFSPSCVNALNVLFAENNNLFDAADIEFACLIRHIKRMFKPEEAPTTHPRTRSNIFDTSHESVCLQMLYSLGLLPKLVDRLRQHNEPVSHYYLHKIQVYFAYFSSPSQSPPIPHHYRNTFFPPAGGDYSSEKELQCMQRF